MTERHHPLLYDEVKLLGVSRAGASAPTLKAYKTVAGSPAAGELFAFANNAVNKLTATDDMPHPWMEGTLLEFHVHWKVLPTDNIAAGGVRWFAAVSICDWENGSTETDYLLEITESVPANCAGTSRFISLGTLVPSGKRVSFQGVYTWGRAGNHVADTWTGEPYVTSFAMHYRKDTDGTTNMYTKS